MSSRKLNMPRGRSGRVVLAALGAVGSLSASASAQHVWTGGDGNWSDANKWTPATVPASGNTTALSFNAANAESYTATNDVGAANTASFTLNALTFNNTGTGTITIAAAGGRTLTFGGANQSITATGTGSNLLTVPLVGAGTVTMSGTGTVIQQSNSGTFTGTLVVNGGRFVVTALDAGTFNFNPVSVVVNEGGTFQFGVNGLGNPNLPESDTGGTYVRMNPGGTYVTEEGEQMGGFDLAGGSMIMRANAGTFGGRANEFAAGTVTGEGAVRMIDGDQVIRKTTAGTVTITDVNLNNTGGVAVEEGVLATNAGLGVAGNLTFGTATTNGTLRYTGTGLDATSNPVVLSKPVVLNAGGGTIEVPAAAVTLTYGGVTSGGGRLTKAGPGTLALTAANLHTGGTTVAEGAVQIGNGGTAGSIVGDVTVTGAGTLAFNRSDSIAFAGGISGTGNVSKLGPGSVDLTGPLAHTGTTTVAGGTLRVRPFSTGAVRVNSGTTLAVNYPGTPGTLTASTITLGSGTGASTLRFELNSGTVPSTPLLNVTAADGLVLNGAPQALAVQNTQAFGVGTYTLIDYAGAPITTGFTAPALPARTAGSLVYNTADTRIDLQITGVDSLVWTGAVNGTWDAGTAIDAGGTNNWKLASSNAVTNFVTNDVVRFDDTGTNTTVSLATELRPAGVTVDNASKNYTFQGPGFLATGPLTKQGAGSLTILTNNTTAGDTTVAGGTLQIGNGGTAGSIGTGNLVNNGTVAWNRSDNVTFPGNVTGTGSVTKAGGGTLTFGGAYTPAGNTTVSGGALALAANVDYTYAGQITGAGALAKSGSGTVTLTGNSTYAGGTTITGGVLQVGNGGTTGAITGNVSLGSTPDVGTLVFNRSGDLTLAGDISGGGAVTSPVGGITKLGAGTVTLSGTVTQTGPTIVSGGTLAMTGNNTLTNRATVNAASTLALSGSNTLLGPIVVNAGGTLAFQTVDFDQILTQDVALSGAGTIVKTGNGVLDVQGANNPFTGTVVVNGGTVLLSDPNAKSGSTGDLGATSVVVNSGGTFQFGVGGVTGEDPNFPNATYLTANPGGTIRWVIGETLGGFNLLGGTLTFAGGGVTSNGTAAQSWTSGTINGTAHNYGGSAAIVKTTPGTVTVAGLATATAAMTIQDGTVALTAAANLNTNGSGTGGGNLTLGVAGGTTGRFEYLGTTPATRTGTVALAGPGAVRVTAAAGTLTLSGVLSGSGTLTKEGPGTLRLTGNSTSTGGVSIAAGTLLVSNAAGSGTGTSPVTVAAGTLGGTGTIAGPLTVAPAGTLAPGESAGVLKVGGPVTLQSLSNTVVELGKTAASPAPVPGTDYDQLALTGTGTTLTIVDGARLRVTELAGVANGQSFTIVDNTADGTVAGVFYDTAGRSLTEGATIVGSLGTPFTISYAGGDVVLSTVPEPASLAAAGLAAVGLLARRKRRAHR